MTKDSLLFFFLRFHREINIFAELIYCPLSGHNNNNVITTYKCNLDRQVTYKLLLHLQSSLAFDFKNVNRPGNLALHRETKWLGCVGKTTRAADQGWRCEEKKMKTETNKYTKFFFFPIKYFEMLICSILKYFSRHFFTLRHALVNMV